MWWRGAIIGMIVGLWIAVGLAGGPTAALLYGLYLLIACLFVAGVSVGGGATQQFGAWYHDRQLRGRHRR
jgi:hypothetical protein